jgi:hypothetical protein
MHKDDKFCTILFKQFDWFTFILRGPSFPATLAITPMNMKDAFITLDEVTREIKICGNIKPIEKS